jgi:hypothetical protein
MLKKIPYLVLFALIVVLAASCQKEEVKPLNPANGSGCEHNGQQRDGDGDPTDPSNDPTNGDGGITSTGDGTSTGDEGDEDEGITDGGNSSEHDSKGKRKKP